MVTADQEASIPSCSAEIQKVLDTFSDVFATSTGLPPERPYDHAIPLTPDAAPFNSRPYRYSPAHKNEIEKQLWFEKLGTKLKFITAYHPQTDGKSERVNQSLEMYLRCSIQENPKQWKRWLAFAEFWYNSTFHTALGCSPFRALYGHEPNFGAIPTLDEEVPLSIAEMLTERNAHMDLLKKHLAAAQNRMKQKADKNRTEKSFQTGEAVLLKLQPYVQKSVVNRPYPKIAFKHFGPYKILERVGHVAYKLELPPEPVFHVSQLKEYRPDDTLVFTELPKFSALDLDEPDTILDTHMVKKDNAAITQVLVKWKHLDEDSVTWEDWAVLVNKFPSVLSWGQASSSPGGNVTQAVAP